MIVLLIDALSVLEQKQLRRNEVKMGVIYCRKCHRKIKLSPNIKVRGLIRMECMFCGAPVVVTQAELNNTERNVIRKYHRQGCTNIYKCFKNHVSVGANTTLEHLQGVVEICYNIRKLGQDFITEAVPNNDSSRRIDVVNLSTGEEIIVSKENHIGVTDFITIKKTEYERLINKNKGS